MASAEQQDIQKFCFVSGYPLKYIIPMSRAPRTLLHKTFDIVHSSFLLLAIACALHVLYIQTGKWLGGLPWLLIVAILLFVALKIFLFSGIYGTIIELASQETPAVNRDSFLRNARAHWKRLAPLLLAYSLVNALLPRAGNSFNPAFFVDLIFCYFVAFVFIRDKYFRPLKLERRRTAMSPGQVLTILTLFVLTALALNVRNLVPFDARLLSNEPITIYTYLHFLMFTHFVLLVLQNYPEIENAHNPENEIYLINPSGGGVISAIASQWLRGYPPIFITLKALTPAKYLFKEFNRIPFKNRFFKGNKLVAITCYTSNCAEAYKIAKEYRRQGSTVVMGGPHVTYLPNEALQFCDAVVTGEAESVWQDIIADYEHHSLKKTYCGAPTDEYRGLIHQQLLKSPSAIAREFIETTRGCKYSCNFCTIPFLTHGKVRKKPVSDVVELIKKIAPNKFTVLLFIDNNIFADPEYARELFTALIPLKISWATQCSVDIAQDTELLNLARKSGCTQLLFGYEVTGSSNEKDQVEKFALAEQYQDLTRKVKKAGIMIKAHFIVGFESDTYRSLVTMWKQCFAIMPFCTILSVLTPLPGSQFFYKMLKEDRIANYNWRNYGLDSLVFRHATYRNKLFNFFFPIIYVFFLYTTCSLGLIAFFITILDAAFFGLQHVLF